MRAFKSLLFENELIDLVVLAGVSLLVILVLLAMAESMSALFQAIGVSYDAQQAGASDVIQRVFVGIAQISS